MTVYCPYPPSIGGLNPGLYRGWKPLPPAVKRLWERLPAEMRMKLQDRLLYYSPIVFFNSKDIYGECFIPDLVRDENLKR